MKTKSLSRTSQCATCPWKKNADPNQIPGYCPNKHRNLAGTILSEVDTIEQISMIQNNEQIMVMECHYSSDDKQQEYCIGYLHNQLTNGNNIALRFLMTQYENVGSIKVFGEQHQTFEETLPE